MEHPHVRQDLCNAALGVRATPARHQLAPRPSGLDDLRVAEGRDCLVGDRCPQERIVESLRV